MRQKTLKMLSSIAVVVSTLGLLGCEQITSSNDVHNDCPEKMEKSRSGYPWERIAYIDGARDIAGLKNVYIITADGKSILELEQGGSEFLPVANNDSIFRDDPAVTISAGGHVQLVGTPIRWDVGEGVYVTTESKKVYNLRKSGRKRNGVWSHSRYWTPANTNFRDIEAVAVTPDSRDNVFAFSDGGIKDTLLASQGYTGSFGTVPTRPDSEQDLLAIDGGMRYTYSYPAGHLPVSGENFGVYWLTKDNKVYSFEINNKSNGPYFAHRGTGDITPSQDIAASPVEKGGFATFQVNTNNVYYFNKFAEKIDIGAARKITITEDNYLWDAYGRGIWRKRIK